MLVADLQRVLQDIEARCTESIKDSPLTLRQLLVLKVVESADGQSQVDLTSATGIDRSTIADIVRRLVDRALLRRRRTKHDARTYAVSLTEDGRRALTAALDRVNAVERDLLSNSEISDLKIALHAALARLAHEK
jgi:DNA-binding MarR family transcriptional regulator